MLKGAAISLIGVIIIVLRPIFENGYDSSLIGNIFFVVSMGLSVFYTLLLKEIAPKYNPLTLTFWIFVITSISFIPFVFFEAAHSTQLINLDFKSIIGILFGAVFASLIAYSLEIFALKHISANEVAVFSYIDPVIAVIIAKPLLGESITSTFLLGSFLIFLGIYISEGRLNYHPLHLLKPQSRLNRDEPQLVEPNLNLSPDHKPQL